jgi:hypothetical protein
MDHLRAQKTPNNLVAALEYLPSSLDNMYKQTLDRSPNQEQALCLLSWVLLAERPLSVDELRHAVAWRVDATELLDDGDLEDEESLLSLCAGLVMLRREKREKGSKGDSWQGSDEYNTVVFTRESSTGLI